MLIVRMVQGGNPIPCTAIATNPLVLVGKFRVRKIAG